MVNLRYAAQKKNTTIGHMMAHPTNSKIHPVRMRDIMLKMTPFGSSRRITRPAAHPPMYVRMNVALGIWIRNDSETIPVLNNAMIMVKLMASAASPPEGVWKRGERRDRAAGALPFCESVNICLDAAPI
jgi:hypothetical protein